MRVLYIYNPHNAKEVELKDRALSEIQEVVEEVEAIDFTEISKIYKIRATPALIFLRDDLQGENLLTENVENGKLLVVGSVLKYKQVWNLHPLIFLLWYI